MLHISKGMYVLPQLKTIVEFCRIDCHVPRKKVEFRRSRGESHTSGGTHTTDHLYLTR
jgi:hypothetical protein